MAFVMPIVTRTMPAAAKYGMFLQRADHRWEEVDQYCYDHWEDAILRDGTPRYNGNRLQIKGGSVKIDATLSMEDAAIVARIVGFSSSQTTQPRGFVDEPEFVPFAIKRGSKVKTTIHQVGTDEDFVQKSYIKHEEPTGVEKREPN